MQETKNQSAAKIKLKETEIRPNGHFHLTVRHKDGRVEIIEDHNLVVDTGRHALALLLAGQSTDAIKYAAIGNGADAETTDDTELTNQLNIEIEESAVEGNVATFKFVVDYDTANGMDIHEFGLITESGVLFSRRMRQESLVKADDLQIEGAWEVTL